jgi:hypothetical protein
VLLEVHGLLDDQVYGVLIEAEEVLLDVQGLLDHQVYGVLVEAEEVLHFELVDSEEVLDHQVYGVLVLTEEVVLHFELIDFEDVVHFELVDFEDVHFELVEEVFVEEHGVEVVFDEVHGVEVFLEDEHGVEDVLVLLHLVEDDDLVVDEVHGLVDEVEHALLDVVDLQPEEHEVLVQIVAGVMVQVLQLVVTVGFPAVVTWYTSQCFEVAVTGWHSFPDSHTTVGHTGPVS